MALGKSLCYWGRMNMYKLFHMPWEITWQAKVGIPLAISLPLAGGNSSPKNILGKLFPDDYPLKCKYIYPSDNFVQVDPILENSTVSES